MASVTFTQLARDDVESIAAYIGQDNPAAVVHLVDKLMATCD